MMIPDRSSSQWKIHEKKTLKPITIGSLQRAIHVVQNRRAGERKSHLDIDKQKKLPFQIMYVFYLSCPRATFALQRGGFVARKWLAAKGLLEEICDEKF